MGIEWSINYYGKASSAVMLSNPDTQQPDTN